MYVQVTYDTKNLFGDPGGGLGDPGFKEKPPDDGVGGFGDPGGGFGDPGFKEKPPVSGGVQVQGILKVGIGVFFEAQETEVHPTYAAKGA